MLNLYFIKTGDDDDIDDVSGSLMERTGNSMDDMYKLYCRHARATGFSVRKGTSRSSTTGIELARFYLCSCAGIKQKKAEVETTTSGKTRKKKLVGITRTNCPALLHVKRNKEGIYEVHKHVMQHNHNLTRPEWGHHHRSERKIPEETAKIIEQMISCGIKAAQSYHYLEFLAGGKEHVGHTMRDHLNFVSRLNLNKIESGDAQTLIDILEEESANDPEFYYSVRLDGEARLANIFWRDSSMRDDYGLFGDVVVFDTTYRTNKYDLICAPFVGITSHWKNVMFGCAFISDEKTETFEWLFKAFSKSMGGKHPVSIFTDQDLAMSNGIEKVRYPKY